MRGSSRIIRILLILAVGVALALPATAQQASANAPKPAKSAAQVYGETGSWTFNGRSWVTNCTNYSSTVKRCETKIWGTQVTYAAGKFTQKNQWVFNNLTYLKSPRATWEDWNVLVTPGEHDVNGRKWKTECNTAWTGQNACRSQIWSTVAGLKDGKFQQINMWVFNNIVHLEPLKCAITEKQLADVRKEPSVISTCIQSKLDPNWLAVQYPVTHKGTLYHETAFFNKASGGWAHKASGGLHVSAICDYYEASLPHAFDLADTITYCFKG